jgi:hypothetical protein
MGAPQAKLDQGRQSHGSESLRRRTGLMPDQTPDSLERFAFNLKRKKRSKLLSGRIVFAQNR